MNSISKRLNDKNIVKLHENSPDYLKCTTTWSEETARLEKGQTVDKVEMAIFEAERMRGGEK